MKKSIKLTTSDGDGMCLEVVVRGSRSFLRVIDTTVDVDVIDLTPAKALRLRDWLTEYLNDQEQQP